MAIQNPKALSLSNATKFFTEAQKSTRVYHDPSQRGQSFHNPSLRTVAWNNLGTRLATGGAGNSCIKIWNPEKVDPRSATDMKGSQNMVTEKVMWDPTHAENLASCGSGADGVVRGWDYRTARASWEVKTGGDNISLVYHPDGNVVVVGRKDDQIKFIDLRTHSVINTLNEPNQTNQQIFSPAGDLFLQTHGTGAIKIRDFPSLQTLFTFDAHTSACFCLELDPRGRYLATGGSDALVSLWDTTDWICVRTFAGGEHPIRSVGFSFDGAFLTGGSDEVMPLQIAHVETGEYVHTVNSNFSAHTIAWHPSKYVLAYTGEALRVVGMENKLAGGNA